MKIVILVLITIVEVRIETSTLLGHPPNSNSFISLATSVLKKIDFLRILISKILVHFVTMHWFSFEILAFNVFLIQI